MHHTASLASFASKDFGSVFRSLARSGFEPFNACRGSSAGDSASWRVRADIVVHVVAIEVAATGRGLRWVILVPASREAAR